MNAIIEQTADDPDIHIRLVAALLSVSLDRDRARTVLSDIIEHHQILSGSLGREVDLRVAAMDYATMHPDLVPHPVVVDHEVLALSQRLAAVDELTGLFNRRFLDLYLSKELNRARRYGLPFSVLFVDLDDFKRVNDGYGHDAGDAVLRAFASQVSGLLRKEDFAARFGGEEFLVVMPRTRSDGALRFADRLAEQVARVVLPHGLAMTFSGGVATYPEHAGEAEELVKQADVALYQAKMNGKAHVRVAPGEQRSSPRHTARLRALCYVEGREIGEVRLHDISRAGVSADAGARLRPGQTLRFRIEVPGEVRNEREYDVFAQIIWSRQVDDVEYRFGGRWASADEAVLQSLIEQVASE